MKHLAVIDLGTNTFHLLVAEVGQTSMEILHKEKQSVKIGEGGISHGIISDAAGKRALNTLKEFRATMDHFGVDQLLAFATSAFRNARNREELLGEIQRETGIAIQVISGSQEADYIYQGVTHALELGAQDNLIMDIGGGSVEFVIANQDRIHWKESYEIGAQRLMDKFHYHDPIYPQEIQNLESFLDRELSTLVTAMEQFNPRVLIGSSGTFDTLSEIYCLDQGITPDHGPERRLSLKGYQEIHQRIISKNRSQRLQIPGMIAMRVDMIVVASSLIHYLLDRFRLDGIRVSAYALKEGVLFESIDQIRQEGV